MSDLLFSLPVFLIILAVGWVLIPRFSATERPYLWASLFAHLASGIAMVLVTVYYYGGGDMTNYFAVGQFLAGHLRSDFFTLAPVLVRVILQQEAALPVPGTLMMESNTGSMQALSGFVVFFFQDSLYAVCLAIAGLSFVAKAAVYSVIRRELPSVSPGKLCFACLLVPSTVFWSSGLLKEPFAMMGMSAMLWSGHKMVVDRRLSWSVPAFAAGALTTGLLKGYVLLVFGVAAGVWLLARAVHRQSGLVVLRARYMLGALVLTAATLFVATSALPQFAPEVIADEARTAQVSGAHVQGGSYYELGSNDSVSAQIPLAMATVFFRPLLVEVANPLILLNALEMTWLTIMVVIVVFRRPFPTTLSIVANSPMLAFCVTFVVSMAIGVGLTTTNLGTLSRYRMPLMALYAVMLACLASRSPLGERRSAPLVLRGQTSTRRPHEAAPT